MPRYRVTYEDGFKEQLELDEMQAKQISDAIDRGGDFVFYRLQQGKPVVFSGARKIELYSGIEHNSDFFD